MKRLAQARKAERLWNRRLCFHCLAPGKRCGVMVLCAEHWPRLIG